MSSSKHRSKRKKRQSSSTRKRIRPSVVYKMQQSVLFQKTLQYHESRLKKIFMKHYKHISRDDENWKWTSNLCDKTMEKLQLHLSWVMGLNVFEWDRQNIGKQTIETFKKMGVFECLLEMMLKRKRC